MTQSRTRIAHSPPAPAATPSRAQLARLNELFTEILPANPFHSARLGARLGDKRVCETPANYHNLPLLTKDELVADSAAHPPFGTNLTYPLDHYTRYHQTSGTTGPPLRVLDTAETWDWWGRCWVEPVPLLTKDELVADSAAHPPFA